MTLPVYRFGHDEYSYTHIGRTATTAGGKNDGTDSIEVDVIDEFVHVDTDSPIRNPLATYNRRKFDEAAGRAPHLLRTATSETRTIHINHGSTVELSAHTQRIRVPKYPRLEAVANFFFGRRVTVLPAGEQYAHST